MGQWLVGPLVNDSSFEPSTAVLGARKCTACPWNFYLYLYLYTLCPKFPSSTPTVFTHFPRCVVLPRSNQDLRTSTCRLRLQPY